MDPSGHGFYPENRRAQGRKRASRPLQAALTRAGSGPGILSVACDRRDFSRVVIKARRLTTALLMFLAVVTIDRANIFDTMGWPGLCDMVHVAVVQGNCEPPGGQTDVVARLSATSFAKIPSIDGPLACAGEPAGSVGAVPNGLDVPGTPLSVSVDANGNLVLTWSPPLSPAKHWRMQQISPGRVSLRLTTGAHTDG